MYTVLTVDDEIMMKRTIKILLEREGGAFTVVGEAEDGGEALALMESLQPDLVITDIRMPVMDGLELIQEARSRGFMSSFVILSGHDDFAYAQQAMRYEVSDYILKPLKPELLREALGRVKAKLETSAVRRPERRDRLWYCKSKAEPLAESVWLLHEEGTAALLADIHQHLSETTDGDTLRDDYVDLLTLLDGTIAEKSGGVVRVQLLERSALPDNPDALLQTVQAELARVFESIRGSRNWLGHHNMKRAAAYLEEHYTDAGLSLQEVADVIGISSSYFSRMFKEEFGISFIQHVTKLRMDKACELLADPQSRTYEVAYAVGYQDYPHFAKLFKKIYGLTPTDYKKRIDVQGGNG